MSDSVDMSRLEGLRFGRLIVLERVGSDVGNKRRWRCRCDCGGEKTTIGTLLRMGRTQSCGCLQRERARGTAPRHAMSGTPEYAAWSQIKQRTRNPKNPAWPQYGGRGIGMAQIWALSFDRFLADVGRRPSPKHSIGRINNEGHYEPGNVEWQTAKQQAQNRRPPKKASKYSVEPLAAPARTKINPPPPPSQPDLWEWRGTVRTHKPGGT